MKIENESSLDDFIICHHCYTLHQAVPIKDGSKASCSKCKGVLYRYDTKLIDHGLAMGISGLIFFIVANAFPLLQIEILGHTQFITMPKTIFALFDHGFYLVGFLCLFLIMIFPLMIFIINIVLFTLLKFGYGLHLSQSLLILLSQIRPWSMPDIFFISILVALVKLVAFGQIHIGISFWALMLFVLTDLYITKMMHLSEIWMLRKRIFFDKKRV